MYDFSSFFDTIFTCNKGSVLAKRSLYFIKTEPLFHQDRGSVLFSPHVDESQPTDKQPQAHVSPTFACHAEYIDLPASLKALNALPPAYNIFLQGMTFSAFSRYLLLSGRLQTKLKRLKPDNSVKIQ